MHPLLCINYKIVRLWKFYAEQMYGNWEEMLGKKFSKIHLPYDRKRKGSESPIHLYFILLFSTRFEWRAKANSKHHKKSFYCQWRKFGFNLICIWNLYLLLTWQVISSKRHFVKFQWNFSYRCPYLTLTTIHLGWNSRTVKNKKYRFVRR